VKKSGLGQVGLLNAKNIVIDAKAEAELLQESVQFQRYFYYGCDV
jgi:hypothetical protein